MNFCELFRSANRAKRSLLQLCHGEKRWDRIQLFLLVVCLNLIIFAFDNEEDSIHHRHPLSAPGLWIKKGV